MQWLIKFVTGVSIALDTAYYLKFDNDNIQLIKVYDTVEDVVLSCKRDEKEKIIKYLGAKFQSYVKSNT